MFDNLILSLRKVLSFDKVKLLAIGMEHSASYGDCPGAKAGATKLFKKIKPCCSYAKLLIDAEATKAAVISEMQKVCDSDLAIIVYAGHGGQKSGHQYETDGKDEFLGLYDKPLVDNEIWQIISKAKGRVFTIFDCCHSETMFRGFEKINFERDENVDLLCWSGCADSEVSYGMPGSGGFLTRYILKYAGPFTTYKSAWKKISNNKVLKKQEIVKQTILKSKTKFESEIVFS